MPSTTKLFLSALLAVSIMTAQAPESGREPPKLVGETANGKPIELPAAAKGMTTVLILGFSKQAGDKTGVWQQHLSRDFASDPHFTSYSIAVLESVPSLLRGMVKSGIRNSVPATKRDHMIMTTSGEAAWKQFVEVSDDKVPYLVLLDDRGRLRWRGHGLFEQRLYDRLQAEVHAAEAAAIERQK